MLGCPFSDPPQNVTIRFSVFNGSPTTKPTKNKKQTQEPDGWLAPELPIPCHQIGAARQIPRLQLPRQVAPSAGRNLSRGEAIRRMTSPGGGGMNPRMPRRQDTTPSPWVASRSGGNHQLDDLSRGQTPFLLPCLSNQQVLPHQRTVWFQPWSHFVVRNGVIPFLSPSESASFQLLGLSPVWRCSGGRFSCTYKNQGTSPNHQSKPPLRAS